MQHFHGRRWAAVAVSSVVATGMAVAVPPVADAVSHSTTRVSLGNRAVQADKDTWVAASATPDGRYLGFTSSADNLVPGDTNGQDDVFRRDLKTGAVIRVSDGFRGAEPNGASTGGSMSSDGRYVVFQSDAGNLVKLDNNGLADVFVRDLVKKTTTRISVGLSKTSSSGGGTGPTISGNGQRIAFTSWVTDLVPNDTNGEGDVFVWNRASGKITRVSVGPNGIQTDLPPFPPPAYGGERNSGEASISQDGWSVVFTSYARNLVPDDTNNSSDIFIHNLKTHVTSRVSLGAGGAEVHGGYKGLGSYRPSISADASVVSFASVGADLVTPGPAHQFDWYVRNLKTGVVQQVHKTVNDSALVNGPNGAIPTPDGKYVLWASADPKVVPGDTNGVADVFLTTLKTGAIRRLSVTTHGGQANAGSYGGVATPGGKEIFFDSDATNLVAKDTNKARDVFLRR
jgi:Tol biopolymer transport system component